MTRYLILTALLLATALLAHYDGLAVLVPIGLLLLVLFWQQRRQPGGLLRSLAIAVGVAALLLATFYLPFVRHPSFQSTFYYVVYLRIGSNRVFPYNNLPELMQRNMVYNPWLWVWVCNGMLAGALFWSYRQGWGQRWGNGLGLVALVVSALLLWRSDWLTINGGSYLCVPVLLALVLAWSAPQLTLEGRILWLWFGLPFWLSAFLMGAPGTHTYVYTVPGILLVSALVEPLWPTLQRLAGQRLSSGLAVVTVGVVGLLLGRYAYAYFVDHQTELLLAQQDAKSETANAADNRFEIDRLYGFPLANGWKVVGALYQAGVLQGDFETNQHRDYIPAWYTRGVHRCGSTATWYFAIDNFEFWTADNQALEDLIKSQNFRRWGVVQVNGHPGMVIYKRDGDKQPPKSLLLDEYAPRFDALATPDLPLSYPVINPTIAQPLHSNFEHKIWLEGYQLAGKMPLKPGDTFRLTLYWRAQAPIDQSYKVFTQSYYGNGTMIAQQDSYPVCDRQLTNAWVPGELVADVHDLTIAADAPSGVYPLYTGLYLEATSQRLAVLDTTGAPSDNQVHVADLQVQGDTTQ
jgi:hypothetical protein